MRPGLCPSGRLAESQLRAEFDSLDSRALLLVVGHRAGEQRRIPWMRLARISDRHGWAEDPRDDGGADVP